MTRETNGRLTAVIVTLQIAVTIICSLLLWMVSDLRDRVARLESMQMARPAETHSSQ
jgi:hypothetical protein